MINKLLLCYLDDFKNKQKVSDTGALIMNQLDGSKENERSTELVNEVRSYVHVMMKTLQEEYDRDPGIVNFRLLQYRDFFMKRADQLEPDVCRCLLRNIAVEPYMSNLFQGNEDSFEMNPKIKKDFLKIYTEKPNHMNMQLFYLTLTIRNHIMAGSFTKGALLKFDFINNYFAKNFADYPDIITPVTYEAMRGDKTSCWKMFTSISEKLLDHKNELFDSNLWGIPSSNYITEPKHVVKIKK